MKILYNSQTAFFIIPTILDSNACIMSVHNLYSNSEEIHFHALIKCGTFLLFLSFISPILLIAYSFNNNQLRAI